MKIKILLPIDESRALQERIVADKSFMFDIFLTEFEASLHKANTYCDCGFDEDTYCVWIPARLLKKEVSQ